MADQEETKLPRAKLSPPEEPELASQESKVPPFADSADWSQVRTGLEYINLGLLIFLGTIGCAWILAGPMLLYGGVLCRDFPENFPKAARKIRWCLSCHLLWTGVMVPMSILMSIQRIGDSKSLPNAAGLSRLLEIPLVFDSLLYCCFAAFLAGAICWILFLVDLAHALNLRGFRIVCWCYLGALLMASGVLLVPCDKPPINMILAGMGFGLLLLCMIAMLLALLGNIPSPPRTCNNGRKNARAE